MFELIKNQAPCCMDTISRHVYMYKPLTMFSLNAGYGMPFQALLPPPLNITATISGVPRVQTIANEMFRVSGEVVLEWLPPDNLTEEDVTRYESRVGLVALDLYENTPMSELNSFEVKYVMSVKCWNKL